MRADIKERIEMIERGEVPEGYKKTRLGIIPKQWRSIKGNELFPRIRNGFVGVATPYYVQSGVKYLQGNNVKNGHIKPEGLVYVCEEFHLKNVKSQLQKDDIVMVQSGHVGECAVITEEFEGANCHALIILTPRKGINSKFYSYLFNSTVGKRIIYQITTGNTIKHILSSDMKSVIVPLPSIAEQKHVAYILVSWDHAIELRENLLEQKRLQRKGIIQQILHYCLINYRSKKIQEFAEQRIETNVNNTSLPVLSCTKYAGLVSSLEYFHRQVYGDDLGNYKIVRRNWFAYATNHIEEGSIGLQQAYDEGLVSPMYTVFELKDGMDGQFIFAILKTETYRRRFETMMNASVNRRGSLRWNEFSKIKVPIPDYITQKRMAKIISAATNEIELLERELTQLKLQKKGLMQLLLTGKVRVPC